MNNIEERKSDNEWTNENKKLSYALELYKDSAEDKQAELKGELAKANMQNGKLRQKAKAWCATSVILLIVIFVLM